MDLQPHRPLYRIGACYLRTRAAESKVPHRTASRSAQPVLFSHIDKWGLRCALAVLPPRFDDHLRLGTRTKPFEAQALVAEFAVEALRVSILPWLARLDQCRADALGNDPGQQRPGHELRP